MTFSLTCPNCGRRLHVAENIGRRKVQCPECGVYCAPADHQLADDPIALVPEASEYVLTANPPKIDEDGPLELVPLNERRCPECRQELAPDAVLCVACGLDLKAGKKLVRRDFQPVNRSWEAGRSYRRRLSSYIMCQALIVPLAAFGAVLDRSFFPFFFPWLIFSVLLAFLLGTYERIDLSRNERGRVSLLKTWRVCFVERKPEKIKLFQYFGIRTIAIYGINGIDIAVLLCLGGCGVFPAIIWWFYNLNKVTYHVFLTGEDGHSDLRLCTSKNEEQMQDLAQTIHSVSGLPCKVG
jgi:hypothetical protein